MPLAIAALAVVLIVQAPTPAQSTCRFALGFAALHDQIPDVVGECVDNENYDPRTGDSRQKTFNGLLVWRKADNWTAFTNGIDTWIDGPLGPRGRGDRLSPSMAVAALLSRTPTAPVSPGVSPPPLTLGVD